MICDTLGIDKSPTSPKGKNAKAELIKLREDANNLKAGT